MHEEKDCGRGSCKSLKGSFLSDLTSKERCEIKCQAITLHFKKGQEMFLQGRYAEGLFCLKAGHVKLSLTSSKGDPVTLKLLDSEGTVGQSCLFADRNLYSASCMSDTEVCFFPKRIVQQAVSQYPVLFKKLGTISNEEHEALADLIVSLRSKSIVQRVAQSLIKMLSLYGKDENGYIDAEITKEELANLVGTSIESVFRAISHFKKNKYIKFDKRKIMILNESRLRGIASD